MGNGGWSASNYAANTQSKISSGTSFGYTRQTKSSSVYDWKAHEDLDPKRLAGQGSPFVGQAVRESRDNTEHPNSLPIVVGFDQTGSMGRVPTITQTKLAGLFGLLLRQGYAEDPQVMIAAYGDAFTDRVPLQISQFESDNRIDENIDKLFLEGNGGGNGGESMALLWYYLAFHTATDAWDKRKKKGYAFFVADEVTHEVTSQQVKDLIGDGEPLTSDLSAKGLAKAVGEKWDVRILVIDNMSAQMQGSVKFYEGLFGKDHVLVVEDPDSVTETIALAIGALEGNIDIDADAEDDLRSSGSNEVAIRSAVNATASLKGFAGSKMVVAGQLDLDLGQSGNGRI